MILKEVKKPTEGDLRVETKFAWFPTWVDNRQIWLQRYQRCYEYRFRERWFSLHPKGSFKMACFGWDLIGEKILSESKPTQ